MQANAQVKLHNKFKITVLDAETNEIKREATAYNIVLDRMYKDLIDSKFIIKKIQLGTGTGMITPASTQMINSVLTREMKNRKLNYTNYDGTEFNITGKIIIEAGELVGETITEVGVASDYNLETHAFLKDAEGGIIGIEKTATEVLHVEATVYFTLSFPNWITDYVCVNPQESGSIGGLISTLGRYILNSSSGQMRIIQPDWRSAQIEKDYANKKLIFRFKRYESGDLNDYISKFIANFEDKGRLNLNLKERTEGLQQFRGVNIGIGDGQLRSFILPSRDIKKESLEVKVGGVPVSNYELKTKTDYTLGVSQFIGGQSNKNTEIKGGYLTQSKNFALTLTFSEASSKLKIAIFDNRMVLKKMISFPDRDKSRNTLLYCSDGAEYLVFSVKTSGSNYEIEHVMNGKVEKEKTISVNAHRFFRASNSAEFWAYNYNVGNKLYRYTYNEELKKYEANEMPFTIDPAAGASGTIYNLALNDEGAKFYALLSNKLLEAEIPESGNMVFQKIADVESGTYFGNSMESISTYSPYFVYSKSGNIVKMRRLSHPQDVKTLDIPNSSNLKFIVLNPNAININVSDSSFRPDNSALYTLDFGPDNTMLMDFDAKKRDRFTKRIGDLCYSESEGYYGKYDCEKHIINFSTPPAPGAVITANYDGLCITKTENWVVDVSLEIAFSEGV